MKLMIAAVLMSLMALGGCGKKNVTGPEPIRWVPTSGFDTFTSVSALAVKDTSVFAGTIGGVWRSTDNGATWTPVNTGLTSMIVDVVAVSGTDLYAGTNGGGVFRSVDDGATWTATNTGLTDMGVSALAVS